MKTAGYFTVLLLLVIPILILFSCGANDPEEEGKHDARLTAVPLSIDFGAVPVGSFVDSSF